MPVIGVVEFTSEEPQLGGLLGGELAWRSTSTDVGEKIRQRPVDTIVLHVAFDDRTELLDTMQRITEAQPDVRVLLAGSSNKVVVVAEISSIIPSSAARRENVLSNREMQVLNAIRSGRTNREIATMLGVSRSTVNRHVENILHKLSARNRAQAAAESRPLEYQMRPRTIVPSAVER